MGLFTPALALYGPFDIDVPLNCDVIIIIYIIVYSASEQLLFLGNHNCFLG